MGDPTLEPFTYLPLSTKEDDYLLSISQRTKEKLKDKDLWNSNFVSKYRTLSNKGNITLGSLIVDLGSFVEYQMVNHKDWLRTLSLPEEFRDRYCPEIDRAYDFADKANFHAFLKKFLKIHHCEKQSLRELVAMDKNRLLDILGDFVFMMEGLVFTRELDV